MDIQIICDCSDCNGPRLLGPCLTEVNNNIEQEINKPKPENILKDKKIIRKRHPSIDKL